MALAETYRQIVAGSAGASMFLFAYFGLTLTSWLAVSLGLLSYLALTLLIRPAVPAGDRMVADGVTAADLQTSLTALSEAAGRLRALEERAPSEDAGVFAHMAEILTRIGSHHSRDPRDLRHTRRFIRHDLPRLVETSEGYVDLAARSGAGARDRLAQLAARIRGFAPALDRIDQACLENDFMALEVEAEVLSEQLKHR